MENTERDLDIPFPMVLVTLVKLSLNPKTVFLKKLAAPCIA